MAATAKKKKRRLLWKILIPVLALLLVVVIAALWFAALLFGGVPQLEVEQLQPEDYLLLNKLAGRFSNELLQGRPNESELILTPGEVNSLIRISDNGIDLRALVSGKRGKAKTKSHNARYENGRFEILSPVQTKLTWLWGGVIMADMSVRPEKEGDKLTLDISRAKAGSITLPNFIVRRIRENAVEAGRSHKDFRKFNRCVKSIRIDSADNLHIVYYPPELRNVLLLGL